MTIKQQVKIAVIGGTGVYDPGRMTDVEQVKIYTPYGATSDLITVGNYGGVPIAFLPRHGGKHTIPPHLVPYQANLWALKKLGVERIIAPCAVGSLREELKPGDIVVADQFFDFTKGRPYSFYNGGQVCHIAVANPFCSELRELAISTLKGIKATFHDKGINVCIQGPRYSTKAESDFFRKAVGADIIGMTLVPECVLARELEICYVSIAAVTDYDSWSEEAVDTEMVTKTMAKNAITLQNFLNAILPQIPAARKKCECPSALEKAMI